MVRQWRFMANGESRPMTREELSSLFPGVEYDPYPNPETLEGYSLITEWRDNGTVQIRHAMYEVQIELREGFKMARPRKPLGSDWMQYQGDDKWDLGDDT